MEKKSLPTVYFIYLFAKMTYVMCITCNLIASKEYLQKGSVSSSSTELSTSCSKIKAYLKQEATIVTFGKGLIVL